MTEPVAINRASAPSPEDVLVDENLTTGGKLRALREALGLSVDDVGSALKIPARKIRAMEAEEWDSLPTGPYLRGFLRSYAKVLRTDAQRLIDEIDSSVTQSRSPDTILRLPHSFDTPLPRQPVDSSDWLRGSRLIYIVVTVLLLIGVMVWSGTQSFSDLRNGLMARFSDHPPVTQDSAVTSPTSANASPTGTTPPLAPVEVPGNNDAPANAAAMMQAANSESVNTPVVTPPNAIAAVQSSSQAAASETTAASELILDFQAESWVQVKQSDGRTLMYKTNLANTREILNGIAPLDLIIGNANQVKLQFRGAPVDLAPYSHDNVARLSLK